MRCVHYIGFRDDRFVQARAVFGGPVFIHRTWDRRSQRDIGPDDLVVFATGPADQPFAAVNSDDITEPPTPSAPLGSG